MESQSLQDIEWVDSNTFFLGPDGSLMEAGTCVKVNDTILFLKYYSNKSLIKLKDTIIEAVSHELRKRDNADV